MSKMRVVSDGTPQGTKVLLPDGTDIAGQACEIVVRVVPDELVTVTLTYPMVEVDMIGADEAQPVPHDPVAVHNARKLS